MDKQEILGVNHSTHDLNSHCDQGTCIGLHVDWLSFCAFYIVVAKNSALYKYSFHV